MLLAQPCGFPASRQSKPLIVLMQPVHAGALLPARLLLARQQALGPQCSNAPFMPASPARKRVRASTRCLGRMRRRPHCSGTKQSCR